MSKVYFFPKFRFAIPIGLMALVLSACGSRVLISTGTTIGLKATPGDGSTRPPQVTLGYKRAETALVPTAGSRATQDEDAFSTLAAIYFETRWFGRTELRSFIGTGIAAQEVQGLAADGQSSDQPALESASGGDKSTPSNFWKAFASPDPNSDSGR